MVYSCAFQFPPSFIKCNRKEQRNAWSLLKTGLCPKPLTTSQPPVSSIQNLSSTSITIATVVYVCQYSITLVYGSLKQHPSCVSSLLPLLCWPRSVPKLWLCLRTTHTMASLLVLLSHSHGLEMALYVSLLGYCEPHINKIICVASHHLSSERANADACESLHGSELVGQSLIP